MEEVSSITSLIIYPACDYKGLVRGFGRRFCFFLLVGEVCFRKIIFGQGTGQGLAKFRVEITGELSI